jgi:sugar lactone lactonase YvrE
LWVPSGLLPAQTYTYTTLAGSVGPAYVLTEFDGLAGTALIGLADGMVADPSGTLFLADGDGHRIREVVLVGTNLVVGTLSGRYKAVGGVDGPPTVAEFGVVQDIARDLSGNLYVSDTQTIRKVDPKGNVTTIAGLYNTAGTNDGTGGAARFDYPYGLALDASSNIYVADLGNNTIRMISPAGVVRTLAGVPGVSGTNDGPGATALFNAPSSVALDAFGNIIVADQGNDTIRAIAPNGTVSTLAGLPGTPGTNDGTGSAAQFHFPAGLVADTLGNVFVADSENNAIRRIAPGGVVTTFAVTGSPSHLAMDAAGDIYVSCGRLGVILKISPAAVVTTLPGRTNGGSGHADGIGPAASFQGPNSVALDSSSNVYVADEINNTIRKITPGGSVTTLAGLALEPGNTDGTGSAARFNRPEGVAVDAAGNVYVADQFNDTIRMVTPAGVVTTLAGRALLSGTNDGMNGNARFSHPGDVAVDGSTNIYVTDFGNNTIRKITPETGTNWVVTTLAGSPGLAGTNDGTGGAARFNEPYDLTVDASGNLFVSDTGNQTIRNITAAGMVTTLAGKPGVTGTNDGTGSGARFNFPNGIAVDFSGDLFVADADNNLIRKVTSGGVATTVGGPHTSFNGSYADGTGGDAQFITPYGVAVDTAGNLYVADYGNNVIRKGTLTASLSPVAFQSPTEIAGQIGFCIVGSPNLWATVQTSTDLVNWEYLTMYNLGTGTNYYIGPIQKAGNQYYRVSGP